MPKKMDRRRLPSQESLTRKHKILSKKLKFLKENAQIPPRKNPDRQEKKTQRRILSSDLAGSEASCLSTRAREGGRRSAEFSVRREEKGNKRQQPRTPTILHCIF